MRSAGVVVAIALISGGCRGQSEGDPTKLTVDSKDDATQPIIDDGYRFKLAWPGKGWKLMRGHDANKIVPDAVAGAIFNDSAFAAVIVEAAPGVELEAYADMLLDNMAIVNKDVENRKRVKYVGTDAVRFVVSGSVDGVQVRFVSHVFLHQGYGYQVLGAGGLAQVSRLGIEVQPLFDNFSLLPGKVSGRAAGPIVSEAQGVGWQVKQGVFASAATGLRVRPANGWRLSVGNELERWNAEAEIGLSHVDPDVYIVAIVERAPPPESRAEFVEQMRVNIEGKRGAPVTLPFAGKPLELTRITSTKALSMEFLHGVHYEGDRAIQILAWYFAAARDKAAAVVPAGLRTFELVPRAERDTLLAELARARDTQSAIGPGYSLRAGVYRSFTNGWSWTKPKAIWRITAGDAARASNKDTELVLLEPTRDIHGQVIYDPNPGEPDAYHALIVDSMAGKKAALPSRKLGDASARVSIVDGTHAGVPIRYKLATITRGARGAQFLFWGAAPDMIANDAIVDAAIDGFRFETPPVVERTEREHRDHRFGFAIAHPPGRRFTEFATGELGADRSVVIWESGASMVGVFGIHLKIDDEKWMLDFIEQAVRDRFGHFVRGSAKRSESTLAGVPTRYLAWPSLDVYVMARDSIVYAFITTPGTASRDSFRLLE